MKRSCNDCIALDPRCSITKSLSPLEKALRDSCNCAVIEVDRLDINLSELDLDEGDLDEVMLDFFGIQQCSHCGYWLEEQDFESDEDGLTCNSCIDTGETL